MRPSSRAALPASRAEPLTEPAHEDVAAPRWRERLRAALLEPLSERQAAPGEVGGTGHHEHATRRAAVLIPIVGASRPYIYFTQRSDALRHHPGQISFPGGSVEAFDASAQAAALREAQEEIGLDPAKVEILGELPAYRTGTGFIISPYVGWVDPSARVTADEIEVARIFGVPLAHALDDRQFSLHALERDGREYQFYAIDYDADHIWGATAGILYGLLQRLRQVEAEEAAVNGTPSAATCR